VKPCVADQLSLEPCLEFGRDGGAGLETAAAERDRGVEVSREAAHSRAVFIGPFEHHSNELPWRESAADVVTISEDTDGRPDLDHLEHEPAADADRPLKIGSFSAASNVTGIIADVDGTSRLLHDHGALACFDYAAAGPYLPVDMAGKDAVFLSPHKFVGGPGTPGVLVAKRALLHNRVPSVPGGGTVLFVSSSGHVYHPDPVIREEGGTPAIVESIRAGLVCALKEQVGVQEIHRREQDFAPAPRWLPGAATRTSRSSAAPRPNGYRSSRSGFAIRRGYCTETSWWRCSAICSGSRLAAAVSAPAPTFTAAMRSTMTGLNGCTPSAP